MSGHRAFLESAADQEADRIVLDDRESHHLARVLRLRVGDPVEVLDGLGGVYDCRAETVRARGLRLRVESERRATRPRPELRLLQSLPKGKTMESILRTATEIGVDRIRPVVSEQGEVRLSGERLQTKLEKWRLTMVEACKQCGLPFLPVLEAPTELSAALDTDSGGKGGTLRLVASLEAGAVPLHECLRTLDGASAVEAAVGPEGDFSRAEYGALREAGYQPVRLGANVLRAETAAAYILSVADQLTRQSPLRERCGSRGG